jgi:hypothetical protein
VSGSRFGSQQKFLVVTDANGVRLAIRVVDEIAITWLREAIASSEHAVTLSRTAATVLGEGEPTSLSRFDDLALGKAVLVWLALLTACGTVVTLLTPSG